MIHLKTEDEMVELRRGGKMLAEILETIITHVRAGVSTLELDSLAQSLILSAGCRPAFLGYQGLGALTPFPATLCTSVNHEVVHGIPKGDVILQNGDIVGLDIGLMYPGILRPLILDMAKTVGVGRISGPAQHLLQATEQALASGIASIMPGNQLEDVSSAIQKALQSAGLAIVRDLCGHGVGYELHEEPYVLNYLPLKKYRQHIILQPGMVLALEPMATLGGAEIKTADDGWTVVTQDRSLAAQFEHTVAVTADGHEVLTAL